MVAMLDRKLVSASGEIAGAQLRVAEIGECRVELDAALAMHARAEIDALLCDRDGFVVALLVDEALVRGPRPPRRLPGAARRPPPAARLRTTARQLPRRPGSLRLRHGAMFGYMPSPRPVARPS